MHSFGPVGSLFCIPLSGDACVVAQVTQSHGERVLDSGSWTDFSLTANAGD